MFFRPKPGPQLLEYTKMTIKVRMQLLVTGVDPNIRAVTQRALKVCNSYLYVLDAVLLPAQNNRLSAIPEVNATFLQALANLGNPSSSSSSSTSGSVGNITDPVSRGPCSLAIHVGAWGLPCISFDQARSMSARAIV